MAKKGCKPVPCIYKKEAYGYVSGCGYRAAYNRFWHFCPYCGRRIDVL